MKKERDYESEMALSEGWTCDHCKFFRFCCQLIGDVSANKSCDWAPSRFQIDPLKVVRR